MKKKITPFLSNQSTNNSLKTDACEPGQEVIKFLKLFARNYQVEPKLPEGLQGIIVG